MTKYPIDYDNFIDKKNAKNQYDENGDFVMAEDINHLQDAVTSIQKTLGKNPHGTSLTVKDKLEELSKSESLSMPSVLVYEGNLSTINNFTGEGKIGAFLAQFNCLIVNDRSELLSSINKKFGASIYGMIDCGVTTSNLSYGSIQSLIAEWKSVGATGIYLSNNGYEHEVPKRRLNEIIAYVREQKMKLVFEESTEENLFSNEYHQEWNQLEENADLDVDCSYHVKNIGVNSLDSGYTLNKVLPRMQYLYERREKLKIDLIATGLIDTTIQTEQRNELFLYGTTSAMLLAMDSYGVETEDNGLATNKAYLNVTAPLVGRWKEKNPVIQKSGSVFERSIPSGSIRIDESKKEYEIDGLKIHASFIYEKDNTLHGRILKDGTVDDKKIKSYDGNRLIRSINIKENTEKIQANAIASLNFDQVSGNISVDQIKANVIEAINANIGHANIEGAVIKNLDAGTITADSIKTDYFSGNIVEAINFYAKEGKIDKLEAGSILAGDIKAENIQAEVVNAINLYAANAQIGDAVIDKAAIGKLDASNIDAEVIKAINISAESAVIQSAKIGELTADKIQAEVINAINANIGSATIDSAKIGDLSADHITAGDIEADRIKAQVITAVNASIGNATIDSAKIGELTADKIEASVINAINANIGHATIDGAVIKDASIGVAQIDLAKIQDAIISDAVIDWAQIENISVSDAMIVSLTASKITAGKIDTGKITISGADGLLLIRENRLQVFDNQEPRIERVSLGDVDGDGSVYGFRVRGADGQTVLYDHNGVKEQGITNGAITSDKIGDGAVGNKHIFADSILAEKLVAGSITTKELGVGSVRANNILAGEIKAGHIKADTIEARHLKADTIEARHIKAGQITTEHLTAVKITADSAIIQSLNADKITSGTIDASKINVVNIKASNITGLTITVGKDTVFESDIYNPIKVTEKVNEQIKKISTRGIAAKINFDSFTGASENKIYIHGYDEAGVEKDVDGFIVSNGSRIVVSKGVIDGAGQAGYIMYDSSNSTWYISSMDTAKKWKKYNVGKAGHNTEFVVGPGHYFIGKITM